MRSLLLLLLALPCGAQQVWPTDEKDSDRLRNLEFLLDKVNVLSSSVTASITSAASPASNVSTSTLFTTNLVPINSSVFSVCHASTMTLVLPSASTVSIKINGNAFTTASAINGGVSILVNGGYLTGCSSSVPCWNVTDPNGSTVAGFPGPSINREVYLSSGSHTFCFGSFANTAGASKLMYAPIEWTVRRLQ